ncbi:sulfatase family protein [Bremerella sp. P1]|uniref:sulfatase family protein n=1 Tax=Bremerella sp. P1 TaxID=3026424 RepID=UPI002368C678|nr:sulfatase [Bremerella sp. P1]WDI41436.1 sulfatase [Bremerella sp. P1]
MHILRTLVLIAVSSLSTAAWAADRPNIVCIIADDLSPELGCYGYQGVSTPNIDRLASEGQRYTAAFSTAPVCSSSRSAFITGVYQTATGTHHHRTEVKRSLPEPIVPILTLLKDAGYYLSNSNNTMTRAGKTDYNFTTEGKLFDGIDWSKRAKGQPFFAQIQIHEPHRGFVQAKDITRAADVEIPPYYPEHPVIRADWANYLASIETLDQHVGSVLKRLEQEGELDNTVIFFFGDHGRPHYRDKQWLYDGGLRVPLLVRWPGHLQAGVVKKEMVSLIDVSAATVAAAGLPVPKWMDGQNFLDSDFPGREMIFAARDRCGDAVDRIRCVRTDSFKYIRNDFPERPYTQTSSYKDLQYPGMTVARVLKQRGKLEGPPAAFWTDTRPAEELYDLNADPDETNNVAGDPKYAKVLNSLRNDLDQWIADTNDQGYQPEPSLQETLKASLRWSGKAYDRRGMSRDVNPEEYLQWWEKELGLK